jgi:hypothetical protein
MADMQVANTILKQLGGNKFRIMTGAKLFIGSENSVSFKIGQNCHHINAVRVVFDPSDTYTMEFYRGKKLVQTCSDVYCDQLQSIFTEVTGLRTRL